MQLQCRNTLRLRSCAAALSVIDSLDHLDAALIVARERGLSVLPLGEGSNVVLAGDLQAQVLLMRLRGCRWLTSDGLLRVAAGESWHPLVAWTVSQGWRGLENLALIPGTVGAAPVQNIGAYGRELAPFVRAVHAVRIDDGARLQLSAAECEFAYRDSIFKHALRDRVVITAVDLQLSRDLALETGYPGLRERLAHLPAEKLTPLEVFRAVVALRREKLPDPRQEPNAGSFFKNPVVPADTAEALKARHPTLPVFEAGVGTCKLAAGWLIEQAGWKGVERHGVAVHPGHALVLVNRGSDSGQQLLALAGEIQDSVRARFGVSLEIEPRCYGAEA